MRRLLTSLLIAVFASTALFAVFFMTHQGAMEHDSCLAGAPFNAVCPQNMSAFPMIDLHFEAMSVFSSATFSNISSIGMIAMLGILLSALLTFSATLLSQRAVAVVRRRQTFDLASSTFHMRITDWLSLHSRRDLSFAVRF